MDSTPGLIQPETQSGLPVLARFLPPLPANVAASCIGAYTQPDELVVNPFCHSVTVAKEAVRLGRRAILSEVNPLTAFIVRSALSLPPAKDLLAGLQRLAETPKGDTPLRTHLRQLYATVCAQCGQPAVASHFVWSRQHDRPVQRAFHCTTCRMDRLEPVSDEEAVLQRGFEDRGFHFWSIIDRLAPPDDEAKEFAVRLLGLYTPRNLYALSTLVSKLETSVDPPALLSAFRLAAVECMDGGSRLMPANRRPSPRAGLRPPAQYLEVNIWDCFAETCEELAAFGEHLAADIPDMRLVDSMEEVAPRLQTLWSAASRPPGVPVSVRRSGAHRLGDDLPPASTALILADPPQLVQGSYFPLSYLWSGWLFGKEAAHSFQTDALLHPRRGDDWAWYLQAMSATFESLAQAVVPGGHVALNFEDEDVDRVRALVLAICGNGLQLERLDFRPLPGADSRGAPPYGGSPGTYLLAFRKELSATLPADSADAEALAPRLRGAILQAIREVLALRGQPSPFVWLNNAIMLKLASEGLAGELMAVKAEGFEPLARLDAEVREAIKKGLRRDLVRVAVEAAEPSGDTSPEPDAEAPPVAQAAAESAGPVSWWLADPPAETVPLWDQVEESAYNMLGMSATFTTPQITRAISDLFPGLQTPEPGLVEAVIDSYSVALPDGQRALRDDDRLDRRTAEHAGLVALLTDLGHRLGFRVWISREMQKRAVAQGTLGGMLSVDERYVSPMTAARGSGGGALADVIWYGPGREPMVFEVEWTGRLQAALVDHRSIRPNLKHFLVIPDERVGLVQYKLERAVLWQQAMARDGWGIIKVSHLRVFAADEPTWERFGEIVGLEAPVERHGQQLAFW